MLGSKGCQGVLIESCNGVLRGDQTNSTPKVTLPVLKQFGPKGSPKIVGEVYRTVVVGLSGLVLGRLPPQSDGL